MLNDKDNESCVFCDGPKIVVPQKKEVKKKEVKKDNNENKNSLSNNNIEECMNVLIKKLDTEMTLIKSDNSNYTSLLTLLLNFHLNNLKDISDKKNIIQKYFKKNEKDESKLKEIESILSLIKENKITFEHIEKLATYGIDLYLDIFICKDNKINLKKINDLGKIIFSLQKLSNSVNIQELIEFPCTFRDKDIINNNIIISDMTIGEIRYYLNVISIVNESFAIIVPLLRPPEMAKLSKNKNEKNETTSLSLFMTKFRYIISPKIKNSILQNIISLTEYDEDLIQIPSFNVERLNDEKNNNNNQVNNDQVFRKYIIKTSRKQGGEIVFKKFDQPNEINYKNLTEFNQVYEQNLQVEPACFRVKRFDLVHVAFKIKYMNELVQGLSGPYRQFFSDIANELENSKKINLLIPTQNNLNKKGEYKDKYTINPKSEEYSQFEFLGFLMGICIRTGVYLPINLCSLVWKKIIGEKINENDIKIFDEGLYKMYEILTLKDNEIDKEIITNSFGENISYITLSDGTQKKLNKTYTNTDLASSIKVRSNLLSEIKNIRLNESDTQIISIIKGINKIIPLSVLQYFSWEEMERLVCGKKIIDIDLLEKNTIISPELEKKDYLVKWVWEIVKEFNEDERLQFVKFCYAQERLPYTQEEYDQKQIQFSIKFNPQFKKNGLPRADTCFFFLILPDYSSKEIMKKMINIAIKMDNVGMNGDKDNTENRRRLERRIGNFGSGFDDDEFADE
jgi:other hect domain ubiquitin protein ligase E3